MYNRKLVRKLFRCGYCLQAAFLCDLRFAFDKSVVEIVCDRYTTYYLSGIYFNSRGENISGRITEFVRVKNSRTSPPLELRKILVRKIIKTVIKNIL